MRNGPTRLASTSTCRSRWTARGCGPSSIRPSFAAALRPRRPNLGEPVSSPGRMRLHTEATAVLAASLQYETALQSVAGLLVPELADWCAVDVVTPDGTLRRAAVAHRDPEQEEVAWEVARRWPLRFDAPEGVPRVIRTGKSALYPELSDEQLVALVRHPEYVAVLRSLGVRSALIVPLAARDCTLGALSLWSMRP